MDVEVFLGSAIVSLDDADLNYLSRRGCVYPQEDGGYAIVDLVMFDFCSPTPIDILDLPVSLAEADEDFKQRMWHNFRNTNTLSSEQFTNSANNHRRHSSGVAGNISSTATTISDAHDDQHSDFPRYASSTTYEIDETIKTPFRHLQDRLRFEKALDSSPILDEISLDMIDISPRQKPDWALKLESLLPSDEDEFEVIAREEFERSLSGQNSTEILQLRTFSVHSAMSQACNQHSVKIQACINNAWFLYMETYETQPYVIVKKPREHSPVATKQVSSKLRRVFLEQQDEFSYPGTCPKTPLSIDDIDDVDGADNPEDVAGNDEISQDLSDSPETLSDENAPEELPLPPRPSHPSPNKARNRYQFLQACEADDPSEDNDGSRTGDGPDGYNVSGAEIETARLFIVSPRLRKSFHDVLSNSPAGHPEAKTLTSRTTMHHPSCEALRIPPSSDEQSKNVDFLCSHLRKVSVRNEDLMEKLDDQQEEKKALHEELNVAKAMIERLCNDLAQLELLNQQLTRQMNSIKLVHPDPAALEAFLGQNKGKVTATALDTIREEDGDEEKPISSDEVNNKQTEEPEKQLCQELINSSATESLHDLTQMREESSGSSDRTPLAWSLNKLLPELPVEGGGDEAVTAKPSGNSKKCCGTRIKAVLKKAWQKYKSGAKRIYERNAKTD